ncbi:MAG: dephospho-CoA kinase [Verrucomicrobiota bacterium]
MPSLAITGSIGSGKSTVLQRLVDCLGLDAHVTSVTSYSADEENRRLLDNNPQVRNLITSALGDSCYDPSGKADRGHLFRLIGADPAAKKTLEDILHPRLESIWKPLAASHRKSRDAFFLAEIPLLFEKELESFFNRSIVVECSDTIRIERLKHSRSLTSGEARQWLKLQHPQHDKILRADHLLWNDGTPDSLKTQIQLLTSLLKTS